MIAAPPLIGRIKALFAVVLVAAAVALPSGAAVGPFIYQVQVFGNSRPEVDPVDAARLFANSAPYGQGVTAYGQAWVRGEATPGISVTVVAEDGDPATAQAGVTTTSAPATLPGGAPNPDAGAFRTSINVTNLGTHRAGADPESSKPADWGPSLITFHVQARTTAAGPVTDSETRTLTKYAGTPHDSYPPRWENRTRGGQKWPSYLWCAGSTLGRPNRVGEFFGCDYEPVQVIAGAVNDECDRDFYGECDPDTYGLFSEIAGITVTISGGAFAPGVTRTYPHAAGRFAGGSSYGMAIRIDDFEPTTDTLDRLFGNDPEPYHITVVVTDAWGATATAASDFQVCAC